jgi:hypothetical protein
MWTRRRASVRWETARVIAPAVVYPIVDSLFLNTNAHGYIPYSAEYADGAQSTLTTSGTGSYTSSYSWTGTDGWYLSAVEVLQAPPPPPIAVDATASSTFLSVSSGIFTTSGDDRMLVVSVAGGAVSGVTYNGTSMTKATSTAANSIYYQIAPATGTRPVFSERFLPGRRGASGPIGTSTGTQGKKLATWSGY